MDSKVKWVFAFSRVPPVEDSGLSQRVLVYCKGDDYAPVKIGRYANYPERPPHWMDDDYRPFVSSVFYWTYLPQGPNEVNE